MTTPPPEVRRALIAALNGAGPGVVCCAKCEPCMFGSHPDTSAPHPWAGPEDIAHAAATGQAPPTGNCGCYCARTTPPHTRPHHGGRAHRKEPPVTQPEADPKPREIGAIGVGMPALLHLEAFGREIDDAFGHFPYLVGSAATSKTWRDVDVRLILPDAEFDALFPEHTYPARHDGRWGLLCAAISELARVRTGLPVDFQIQCQSIANECYPGVRDALGLHFTGGH